MTGLSITEIVNKGQKLGMSQRFYEMNAMLCWIFHNFPIMHNFLEIGTYRGGTFSILSDFFAPGKHIAIDIMIQPEIPSLFESINGQLVLGDSRLKSTVDQVKDILCNDKLDLIFIDSDHKFEQVSQEYANFTPFLRDGGLVIFHDIAIPGIKQFFYSLPEPKMCFIEQVTSDIPEIQGCGLGVKW